MRLLLVAEQLRRNVPGGIGTYTRNLARNVPEVTLWASRAPRGTADGVVDLDRPVVASPLPSRALVWAWDRGWSPPPAGFEVVHAPSLAVPPPPPDGTPLAVTVHDLAWRHVPETFPPRGVRWHEAALGRALDRATLLLAPSRDTADDLLAAGAPASKVEVVTEGCDHLPPPDRTGATALLGRLGIGEDYLLTVSTLEPRKNLDRLVAAYQQSGLGLPLVVVGAEGWGPALPSGAGSEPAGVVLAGPVDDDAVLAGLYAGARLVASVPLVEGFGLPAVEPMALGVPVVASPQPSTGGAAYQVDPLDVPAIAAALVEVATDDPLRTDLVAAGRARAAELTWAGAAAQHLELFESLGSAAGSRR